MNARLRDEDGQAAIELVALLPLVLLIGVGLVALLSARSAAEGAAAAAHAGAIALIQEDDPAAAARGAVPGRNASVVVDGRRVRVMVRPALALPFAPDLLTGRAVADAGPEPAP